MIDTRPAEIENRGSVGHWEGDLINGASATGNLVTLVERNTRNTLIERTSTKEADKILDFKSKFMLFLEFFKIGTILIDSVF